MKSLLTLLLLLAAFTSQAITISIDRLVTTGDTLIFDLDWTQLPGTPGGEPPHGHDEFAVGGAAWRIWCKDESPGPDHNRTIDIDVANDVLEFQRLQSFSLGYDIHRVIDRLPVFWNVPATYDLAADGHSARFTFPFAVPEGGPTLVLLALAMAALFMGRNA